jgi:squalene-hopene/tetraprenyl-beta-curcumene cyclase
LHPSGPRIHIAKELTFLSGLRFLAKNQHPDGSWSPLWFGNQDHPEEDNPVYGTAKVLMAYRDLGLMDSPEAQRGVAWLVANQNADGGWGSGVWGMRNAEFRIQIAEMAERTAGDGVETEEAVTGSAVEGHSVLGTQYSVLSTEYSEATPPGPLISSIEETALAVEALLAACPLNPEPRKLNPHSNPGNATEGVPYTNSPTSDLRPPTSAPAAAVSRGLAWLIDRVEAGQHRQPAPIGFYFAKLWYYEKLYPLTFTVAALGRARQQFAHLTTQPDSPAEPAPSRAP